MKWYRKLYLGERAKKAKYKIFGRIRKNRFTYDTFLISLSAHNNLLDIFSANELKQPYYKDKRHLEQLYIVGIAVGYDEALEVAKRIVEDVYQATGNFEIRKFLHFGNENK